MESTWKMFCHPDFDPGHKLRPIFFAIIESMANTLDQAIFHANLANKLLSRYRAAAQEKQLSAPCQQAIYEINTLKNSGDPKEEAKISPYLKLLFNAKNAASFEECKPELYAAAGQPLPNETATGAQDNPSVSKAIVDSDADYGLSANATKEGFELVDGFQKIRKLITDTLKDLDKNPTQLQKNAILASLYDKVRIEMQFIADKQRTMAQEQRKELMEQQMNFQPQPAYGQTVGGAHVPAGAYF